MGFSLGCGIIGLNFCLLKPILGALGKDLSSEDSTSSSCSPALDSIVADSFKVKVWYLVGKKFFDFVLIFVGDESPYLNDVRLSMNFFWLERGFRVSKTFFLLNSS